MKALKKEMLSLESKNKKSLKKDFLSGLEINKNKGGVMSNNESNKISVSMDGNKAIEQTGGALATIMQMFFPEKYSNAKKKDAQLRFDIKKIEEGDYQYRDNKLVECASNLILEDTINVINTLEKTASKVKNEKAISYDDQNHEFLDAWKGIVRNISSETIQEVFANLLAQELDNPNTVSIRTLKYVESMSANEAKNFVAATKFILPHASMILHPMVNEKMLLKHSQMQSLVDCGMVLSYTPGVFKGTKLSKVLIDGNFPIFNLILKDYIFYMPQNELKKEEVPSISYWQISSSAKELYSIVGNKELLDSEVKEIGCVLLSRNKNLVDKVYCQKVSFDGNGYKFVDVDPIIVSLETISCLEDKLNS